MKVVVSAGGTAGHVNPALAVAQALQAAGAEVWFAGTPASLEERLVTSAGLPFKAFEARGFNRSRPLTIPDTLAKLIRGRSEARRWLSDLAPNVAATFGGYASLPVGLAAVSLKIPLLVQEQNATPGLANRLLAAKAQVVCLGDQRAAAGFKAGVKTEYTGNPLRAELFAADPVLSRENLGLKPDSLVLLVFGGSLGAHHINQAVLNLSEQLLASFDNLEVMHVTGSLDYAWATELAQSKNLDTNRWHILEYCYRMGEAYAACDLVLSRAGATSLAEITALGKPALLVPFPFAAADEQTANARRLVESGAARLIADTELDGEAFAGELATLLADADLRAKMASRAATLGSPQATETIVRLILNMA